MKRKEIIRLEHLKRISHIIKVINSCVTEEQVLNVYNWGTKVMSNYLRFISVSYFYNVDLHYLHVDLLSNSKIKKIKELKNKKTTD